MILSIWLETYAVNYENGLNYPYIIILLLNNFLTKIHIIVDQTIINNPKIIAKRLTNWKDPQETVEINCIETPP